MKRLFVSLALLAALAGLGELNVRHMESVCGEVTGLLEQGTQAAEGGRWGRAAALSQQGLSKWREELPLLHVVLRHDSIFQVTAELEESLVLARWQSGAEYAAANARAEAALLALTEAEHLSVGNLL